MSGRFEPVDESTNGERKRRVPGLRLDKDSDKAYLRYLDQNEACSKITDYKCEKSKKCNLVKNAHFGVLTCRAEKRDLEKEKMADVDNPVYRRHWVSPNEAKLGKFSSGKPTAEFWRQDLYSDDKKKREFGQPGTIFPALTCMAAKHLIHQTPELYGQSRPIIDHQDAAIAPNEYQRHFKTFARPDRNYIPEFMRKYAFDETKNTRLPPLYFEKTCKVILNGINRDYYECERVQLSDLFVALAPRFVQEIYDIYDVFNEKLQAIDEALCEKEFRQEDEVTDVNGAESSDELDCPDKSEALRAAKSASFEMMSTVRLLVVRFLFSQISEGMSSLHDLLKGWSEMEERSEASQGLRSIRDWALASKLFLTNGNNPSSLLDTMH